MPIVSMRTQPSVAVIGVRSSCDTVARNASLARFASTAAVCSCAFSMRQRDAAREERGEIEVRLIVALSFARSDRDRADRAAAGDERHHHVRLRLEPAEEAAEHVAALRDDLGRNLIHDFGLTAADDRGGASVQIRTRTERLQQTRVVVHRQDRRA